MSDILDAPVDRSLGPQDSRTNLIVNYLPQSLSDEEFHIIFAKCGPLNSAKIIRTPGTGYSHGYGFINYQQCEDAAKAVAEINGMQIHNKQLKVSYSRPNCDHIRDTNLYVAHLGNEITELKLEEIFQSYGKILTMKLLKDPSSGRPKGTAFIRFNKRKEAADAITGVNGKLSLPGAHNSIHVKIAEDQGKQKGGDFNSHNQQGYYAQHLGYNYGMYGGGYGTYNSGYSGPQRSVGSSGGERFNPIHRGRSGGKFSYRVDGVYGGQAGVYQHRDDYGGDVRGSRNNYGTWNSSTISSGVWQ